VGEGPGHILRRRIGYVFQDVGLFPHMTVADNIGVTPKLLGWPRADIAARVAELFALVDLPGDFGARPPAALSGGQRQRVGIARARAARPDLMQMDEPFGALDPVLREALGREYRRIHDDLGLTTLMVTHDVVEAVLLADRILVLREGRVVADGTPRTLLTASQDAEVRTLMDLPRRQAARVEALIDGTLRDE
jgi:osmoprotectant transport system ATP-binding protein